MRNVVIVGATSAIAEAFARRCAQKKDSLFLIGRNEEKLVQISQDLAIRGATNVFHSVNAMSDPGTISLAIPEIQRKFKKIDLALIAYGMLPNEAECETNWEKVDEVLRVNFLSVAQWLHAIARTMENQRSGSLVVLSSVAGDRIRKKNSTYGASKAALTAYALALRARLHAENVRVMVVKPGFVDTPMTASMKKNFLFTSPERVAKDIEKSVSSGRAVRYSPCFWRFVMLKLRVLPERLFLLLPF